MLSFQLFLYDSTMIAPFPLLFFGGDISVFKEEDQETVAVDDFIKFKSPTRIANLVKVGVDCWKYGNSAEEIGKTKTLTDYSC